MNDIQSKINLAKNKPPTPREICAYLDKHVVGQEKAKKVLSVAVYNHYKRIHNNRKKSENFTISDPQRKNVKKNPELYKSNIILLGPTGSGKTFLLRTIANFLNLPCIMADCTGITAVGYIGRDVQDIIEDLYFEAGCNKEKAEMGIICLDEVDKIQAVTSPRDEQVGGRSVQQCLLKVLEGTLQMVSMDCPPKKTKASVYIDTTNILFVACGSFVGLENIIKFRKIKELNRRRTRAEMMEEDNEEEVDALLQQVETNDLINYGMIPEFIGRFQYFVPMNSLNEEILIRILKEPHNSLVSEYKRLFFIDKVDLKFTNNALAAIARLAKEKRTGARGLRSIMENVLLDTMFETPGTKVREVTVTEKLVHNATNLDELLTKRASDQQNFITNKNSESGSINCNKFTNTAKRKKI